MEIPCIVYRPSNIPWLRQGEIIKDLFELQLQIPDVGTLSQPQKFNPIDHPYSIIASPDCDLEWDYKARHGQAPEHKQLTHILFCSLFLEGEVRLRNINSELFKRVRQNQDERYHSLAPAPINGLEDYLPWLFADFKITFSLPVSYVYWLVSSGQAIRKGSLPSPHLEDFIHRLYSFLGRVATPTVLPRD